VSARRFEELVEAGAPLTRIGSGYGFTEGPVWVAAERCLLFSDIPGDARWRWSAERGVELVARPTFKGNGQCLDASANLIVCEHVSSSLVRFHDGRRELLAFHHEGAYLNSPNDVVTRRADGSLYFTDPPSGRRDDWIGSKRTRDLDFNGVFRFTPADGGLSLAVAEDEFDRPNGLCFSPDESVLYINDSPRGHVKAFDVAADGSLANARVIADGIGTGVPGTGIVDGMECDELGNVWVTGPGGVWVLAPEGEHLGTVPTPEVTGSLCFGGDDLRTLFLMTSTTAHCVRTLVAGVRLPPH